MQHEEQKQWLIIDLGGAIVSPVNCEGPDVTFITELLSFLHNWWQKDELRHLGLVVGGGAPARRYQMAALAVHQKLQQDIILPKLSNEALDWQGIRATHLNGEFIRLLASSFKDKDMPSQGFVTQPLLTQYDNLPPVDTLGRIVVGSGWKPGFSTDYDSVLLAEHVGAKRLLCLSNIAQIYDDDPAQNTNARPLVELSWENYQKMISNQWNPGQSMPFDPMATARAAEIGLELIFADGRNLDNLQKILRGQNFVGTILK